MRKFFFYLVILAGLILILITAASLLYNTSLWYFQILNFPRLQFLIGLLAILILYLLLASKWYREGTVFIVALVLAIAIQAYILFPYSPLAGKVVPNAVLQSK